VIILDATATLNANTLNSGATDKEKVFSVRTQINF